MKKVLVLVAALCSSVVYVCAQEQKFPAQGVIVRKNGEEIRATILEENETKVRYKKKGNDATFALPMTGVRSIHYIEDTPRVAPAPKTANTTDVARTNYPSANSQPIEQSKPKPQPKRRRSSSQFRLGGIVGLNLSSLAWSVASEAIIEEERTKDSKYGLRLGMVAEYSFGDFAIAPELVFTQKG